MPNDVEYPFVGNGGLLGLDITWQVLRQLPARLTDSGSAHIIGATLGNSVELCATERIDAFCKETSLDVFLSVASHHRMQPGERIFDYLVESTVKASGQHTDEVSASYTALLRHAGASHLCAFFMRVQHGAGQLTIFDATEGEGSGFWYL